LGGAKGPTPGGPQAAFRRRHPFELRHARYRVNDPELLFDVLTTTPIFTKVEGNASDRKEWFHFAVLRRPERDAADPDNLVANMILWVEENDVPGFDLSARSQARFEEAQTLLEVLLSGAVKLLHAGTYEGGWPEPWPSRGEKE
jgi:hypothetical protein